MTKELVAGRELDALVAERVMGLRTRPRPWSKEGPCLQEAPGKPWRIIPSYSTKIEDAWKVVEKIADKHQYFTLSWVPGMQQWSAVFLASLPEKKEGFGDTAPLAICQAALKSLGVTR